MKWNEEIKCNKCRGNGLVPIGPGIRGMKNCPECNGTGIVAYIQKDGNDTNVGNIQVKINGKKEDISAMMLSAERYALGRRTYIVDWTCEFIANNLHLMLEKDIKVMIRDIEQQKEYGYGDKCDYEDWMKLLKILKEKVGNENV